jgi:hypothetical protein
MTDTPSKEDYDNTVEKCAETAAERYGPTNESRKELRTSRKLGEIVVDIINGTEWLEGDMYELAIYYSETSPSNPTHSPIFENIVNLKSEPSWSKLAVEAARICLESDVTEQTIDSLTE